MNKVIEEYYQVLLSVLIVTPVLLIIYTIIFTESSVLYGFLHLFTKSLLGGVG